MRSRSKPCRKPDIESATRLIRAFGINEAEVTAELIDLARILAADYHQARGLPSRQMVRQLSDMTAHGADPRRAAWRKWRTSEDYSVRLRGFDSEDIAVHAEPYLRGAGLGLWGFSCDARIGDRGAFVIFLNTAHQPGAVAATVAHELGHYVYRAMVGEQSVALAPMEANFVSHLENRDELFADTLAALSSYSLEALKKAPTPDGNRLEEMVRALRAIHPEYRVDFCNRAISSAWRIRYLTAAIHFYKLRGALRDTAAV